VNQLFVIVDCRIHTGTPKRLPSEEWNESAALLAPGIDGKKGNGQGQKRGSKKSTRATHDSACDCKMEIKSEGIEISLERGPLNVHYGNPAQST